MPNGAVVLFGFGQSSFVGECAQPAQQLSIHFLSALGIFAVESAPLFALFACLRRTVLLLRVGTPLTLVADEGRDYIAIVTGRRLTEGGHTGGQCNGLVALPMVGLYTPLWSGIVSTMAIIGISVVNYGFNTTERWHFQHWGLTPTNTWPIVADNTYFAKLFDVLLALLADGYNARLALLLELRSTIRAFDDRKGASTFLSGQTDMVSDVGSCELVTYFAELLSLRQLFERVPRVTSGAREQCLRWGHRRRLRWSHDRRRGHFGLVVGGGQSTRATALRFH